MLKFYGTITVKCPDSNVAVTENEGLTVHHLHQCDMPECDGVARHVSPDDGVHLCDVCWEIEQDIL